MRNWQTPRAKVPLNGISDVGSSVVGRLSSKTLQRAPAALNPGHLWPPALFKTCEQPPPTPPSTPPSSSPSAEKWLYYECEQTGSFVLTEHTWPRYVEFLRSPPTLRLEPQQCCGNSENKSKKTNNLLAAVIRKKPRRKSSSCLFTGHVDNSGLIGWEILPKMTHNCC